MLTLWCTWFISELDDGMAVWTAQTGSTEIIKRPCLLWVDTSKCACLVWYSSHYMCHCLFFVLQYIQIIIDISSWKFLSFLFLLKSCYFLLSLIHFIYYLEDTVKPEDNTLWTDSQTLLRSCWLPVQSDVICLFWFQDSSFLKSKEKKQTDSNRTQWSVWLLSQVLPLQWHMKMGVTTHQHHNK